MKKVCFVFLLLLSNNTFCQVLFSGRYVTFSGTYILAKNIIQKKDGGFAFTFAYPDYDRTYVVSIDSSGFPLWGKSFEHYQCSDFDISVIAETADKGFLLAGSHDSIYSFNSAPLWEYLLVKIDSTGSVQWAKTFDHPGLNSYQKFKSIIPFPDHTFLITSTTLQVKTDSIGNVMWMSAGSLRNSSILLSTSEYLTVYGSWVYKFDSLFNVTNRFEVQPPAGINLSLTNVIETMDHDYAFAGLEDSSGKLAVSFIKTDTAGNILSSFRTSFPSVAYNYAEFQPCLIQLADSQFTLVVSSVQGGTAPWKLFIIDNDGQLNDTKEIAMGNYFIAPTCVAKCASNDKYAVLLQQQMPWGSTYNSIVTIDSNDSSWCGTQSVPSVWIQDSLSVQFSPGFSPVPWAINQDTIILTSNSMNLSSNLFCDPFTEVENFSGEKENLVVTPIPASDFVKIKSETSFKHIRILNLYGQIISDENPASAQSEIILDVSKLADGIYLLNTSDGTLERNVKFIISH